LAAFTPPILAVTVRNYVVGDDLILLTANSGRNLFIGNNPTATGSFCSYPSRRALYRYMHGIKPQPGEKKASEISRQSATMALQFAIHYPLEELNLLFKKFLLFFNAIEVGINDHYYFAQRFSAVLRWPLPTFGLVIPIGLTGLVFAAREWRKHLLLIVFLTSQVVSFMIMFVLARYRVVAVACLIALAAAQIRWWGVWLGGKRYRSLATSLIVLLSAIVLVHIPISGFDRDRGLGQQYARAAETYLAWGEFETAIEEYDKALNSNFEPWPTYRIQRARCYAGLADAYAALGKLAKAVELAEAAVAEIELEQRPLPNIQEDTEAMKRRLAELRAQLAAGL
jgi:hypothetical protein